MRARVWVDGVEVGMHCLSACAPSTRGRNPGLLSLPFRVVIGLIDPIRRTRSSRAARALFGQQSQLNLTGPELLPSEQVLSVPDLTTTRRSGPRASWGRGLCAAFVARRATRPSDRRRLFLGP